MRSKSLTAYVIVGLAICTGKGAQANTDLKSLTIIDNAGGTVQNLPYAYLYPKDTKVQIQPMPNAGYKFVGWISGGSNARLVDTITMDSDKVVSALFSRKNDLIPDTGFALGISGWTRWSDAAFTTPSFQWRDGMLCARPGGADPTKLWRAHIDWPGISVDSLGSYTLNIWGKANKARSIRIELTQNFSPNAWISPTWTVPLSTTLASFSHTFMASKGANPAKLEIDLAADTSEVCFESVSLKPQSYAGRALQTSGNLSVRTMRKALLLTTDEPAKWVLRTPDGTLVRSGIFVTPGEQIIWNVPEGVGIFTLQSASSVQVVRISVF